MNNSYINPRSAQCVYLQGFYIHPEYLMYSVDRNGNLFSYHSKRILNCTISRNGYKTFVYCDGLGKQSRVHVHRLVAFHFVPLPPEFGGDYSKATVDHVDGNKLNNHYTNLEWVTREENSSRAWENGLCDINKKKCFCISIEDKKYTPFDSARSMDRSLNLPEGTVIGAINNANGIIQGKYIVGYTENLDQKYLLPKPDAVGIIQLYSKAIANYKSRGKECFCVFIEDEKFMKRDSASDMDRSLNLPEGTVRNAINKSNGIIQGKYIVGYTENLDQKYLSPKPDAVGIIQLYSDAIVNYTPSKRPCFYIDSLDNKYHKAESISDIDKKLNLPIGTAKRAIHRSHGLIRGRYIAGAIDDFRWKKILAKCTVEQIVASYAKKIERYKQRGPRKITNLTTGESETYESLSEFAREQGLDPNNISRYLENHSDLYKVELA